ncbi:MAG: hypothetical protein JWM58_565 [Rhizobium sp.]|nr:hypothetical protein [Rhizobium sp.]
MQHTMQPITTAAIIAHHAAIAARVASGELRRNDLHAIHPQGSMPHVTSIARDVAGEMAQYIVEAGSGTMEDLQLRFSDDEIAKYLKPARDRANRFATRRVA